MQCSWLGRRRYIYTGFCLLLFLLLALSACSGGGSNGNGGSPTPKPGKGTPAANATPSVTATPGIALGAQPCPDAVKSPSHWMAIVQPPTGAQVESVTVGSDGLYLNLKGLGTAPIDYVLRVS